MSFEKEYRRRKINHLRNRITETKDQGEAAFKAQYALEEEFMRTLDTETYVKVMEFVRKKIEYRSCLDRWYHDTKELEALLYEDQMTFFKKLLRIFKK